jgi:hypothetical protein
LLKLKEIITHLGLFQYTNSSAMAGLFVLRGVREVVPYKIAVFGGSICKNSAVLFTFSPFCDIIQALVN